MAMMDNGFHLIVRGACRSRVSKFGDVGVPALWGFVVAPAGGKETRKEFGNKRTGAGETGADNGNIDLDGGPHGGAGIVICSILVFSQHDLFRSPPFLLRKW